MRMQHPNLAKIELIAEALGPLREQLVFVGGCAVDLLLTDPAASGTCLRTHRSAAGAAV